jgi:hypothetical protein
MSNLTPLFALGHSLGVTRNPGEQDTDFATRVLAEATRLRESERSHRRRRWLTWTLRAALAAAGIALVGF